MLGIYFKRFAAEKSSYDKDGIGAESNDWEIAGTGNGFGVDFGVEGWSFEWGKERTWGMKRR